MAHPRRRNDKHPPQRRQEPDGAAWLWGWHAACAALANPGRAPPRRVLATSERAGELGPRFPRLVIEITDNSTIDRALGRSGAAHQGLALLAPPLAATALADLASPAQGVLVVVDQVTDPQNLGAIFRCAAAFGARGVVLQDRHAPALAGAVAKAAAGSIERTPHAREVNLARALDHLERAGWRTVGLDAAGEATLAETLDGGPTALVLGAEGEGLRRLVREHCDVLARIPMSGGFESLNVAAAAAIALYAAQEASGASRG